MKVCLLILITVGLLAGVRAGRKLRKCKAELQKAKDECQADKQAYMAQIDELNAQLYESGASFIIRSCGMDNSVTYDNGTFMLNTDGGIWTRDGWCRVLSKEKGDNDSSYTLSADLYADSTDDNHLGLAYNVKDTNNFDFVYFRPHSATRCFQSGYTLNRATRYDRNGKCPKQVEFQQWFNVKVVVKPSINTAEFYLNGDLVSSSQVMHYPSSARGGVIVANGYGSLAHFKNLEFE